MNQQKKPNIRKKAASASARSYGNSTVRKEVQRLCLTWDSASTLPSYCAQNDDPHHADGMYDREKFPSQLSQDTYAEKEIGGDYDHCPIVRIYAIVRL